MHNSSIEKLLQYQLDKDTVILPHEAIEVRCILLFAAQYTQWCNTGKLVTFSQASWWQAYRVYSKLAATDKIQQISTTFCALEIFTLGIAPTSSLFLVRQGH